MNNQIGMQFLQGQYGPEGMDIFDARAIAIGGCLETSPCTWKPIKLNGKDYWIPGGAGQPTSVGVHFIANPKVLEAVLFNGYDHRLGEQLYPPHNRKLETFEELWQTFTEYYEMTVDCLATTNNIQHDIWRKNNMTVINSFLKPDCLDKGLHIGQLGYRYNATFNVESCGTITMVNSLVALKKLVYEDQKYSLDEMREAIADNFGFKTAKEVGSFSLLAQVKKEGGEKYDEIHHDCLMAPKYGNDDPYAELGAAQIRRLVPADVPPVRVALWQADVWLPDLSLDPRRAGLDHPGFFGWAAGRNDIRRRVHVRLPGNGSQRTLCPVQLGHLLGPRQLSKQPDEPEDPPLRGSGSRRRPQTARFDPLLYA